MGAWEQLLVLLPSLLSSTVDDSEERAGDIRSLFKLQLKEVLMIRNGAILN